jgi:hypothetical protein
MRDCGPEARAPRGRESVENIGTCVHVPRGMRGVEGRGDYGRRGASEKGFLGGCFFGDGGLVLLRYVAAGETPALLPGRETGEGRRE